MDLLFVYGTLKRGFPNYRIGMRRFAFLGRFHTVRAYPLVVGGPWLTPCLLDEPGRGYRVTGEVYRVDAPGLAMLDDFEDVHEERGYRRVAITVRRLNGADTLRAWAYVKRRRDVVPIVGRPMPEYAYDRRYVGPSSPRRAGVE